MPCIALHLFYVFSGWGLGLDQKWPLISSNPRFFSCPLPCFFPLSLSLHLHVLIPFTFFSHTSFLPSFRHPPLPLHLPASYSLLLFSNYTNKSMSLFIILSQNQKKKKNLPTLINLYIRCYASCWRWLIWYFILNSF